LWERPPGRDDLTKKQRIKAKQHQFRGYHTHF